MNQVVGGVLISKVKVLFEYAYNNTGVGVLDSICFVLSLNCLQNSDILIPRGPSAYI